jgi:shikimate kinase
MLPVLSFHSDKLVEQAVGIPTVAEIFQVHSEAFFRDNEVMYGVQLCYRLRVAVALRIKGLN